MLEVVLDNIYKTNQLSLRTNVRLNTMARTEVVKCHRK